jgi:hypothetical protein
MSIARWPDQKYCEIVPPGTGQRSFPLPTIGAAGRGAAASTGAGLGFAGGFAVGAGVGFAVGNARRDRIGSVDSGFGWRSKCADRNSICPVAAARAVSTRSRASPLGVDVCCSLEKPNPALSATRPITARCAATREMRPAVGRGRRRRRSGNTQTPASVGQMLPTSTDCPPAGRSSAIVRADRTSGSKDRSTRRSPPVARDLWAIGISPGRRRAGGRARRGP